MKHIIPIKVRVHYPETEEGIEKYKKIEAKVMIDILEKQLGEENVKKLFMHMKRGNNCE